MKRKSPSKMASRELVWPGARTFFGAPLNHELDTLDAQVAFLGVPYDLGSQSWIRSGQKAGPSAARLQSWNTLYYRWPPNAEASGGAFGWYDVETDRLYLDGVTMADVGDVAIVGADIEYNLGLITTAARRVIQSGALVVAVGGDHSISFPVGRGMEPLGPIDVVHIDSHTDFADNSASGGAQGSRYTHGSQVRRLSELPFVRSITEIGLRNAWRDEVYALRDAGITYATTLDVITRGPAGVVQEMVPKTGNLYVSIDIDVLDLPLVPGTTVPEPGGLSYRQLRELLAEIARQGRVIGFDIVELNPPYDPTGATARIVSWLITHFLAEIFDQPR